MLRNLYVRLVRDAYLKRPEWAFLPSAEQFKGNWIAVPPSDLGRKLLSIHYHSPEDDMHPRHMAGCMGWANADSAHLHYGTFAGATANSMGLDMGERDKVSLFCAIVGPAGDVRWRMHTRVRQAIEALGYHKGN